MLSALIVLGLAAALAAALVVPLRRRRARARRRLRPPTPPGIIADGAADVILAIDERSTILYANPAVRTVFGYAPAELVGRELTLLMPEGLREVHRDAIRRYVETGARHLDWERAELPGLRKNGDVVALEVSFAEQRDARSRIFVGVARDITERRRANDMLRLRCAVAEALAADAPASETVPRIIRAVCDNAGWDAGELWTVDESVGVLRLDTAWSGSSHIASALLIDARRLVLRPGHGLPGRAWAGGKTLWSADALGDAEFRRGDAARRCGLHGGFAVPLRARGRVVGVLALYARRATEPDRDLLDALDALSGPIGEGYHRMRNDAALREHSLRLRVLAELSLELAEAHPDLQLTVEAAVRNTAERVGDLCLGLTIRDDDTFELLAFHHRRPDAVMLVEELRGAATRLLDGTPAGSVVRSGRPLFIPVVTPEQMRPLVNEDYWTFVERAGLASLIVAPLKAQGRLVGAILAARNAGSAPYDSEDVVFLQQLAGRVALAIASAHECAQPAASKPLGIRILAG